MSGAGKIEIPSQSQGLGETNGNKVVRDLLGDDVSIAWTGTKGAPTGTVKYIDNYGAPYMGDQVSGHFFPIKFKDEYLGKEILVGSQNGEGGKVVKPTRSDPYLVIRIENVTVADKISAIIQETGEEVFELDFSGVTLQENPMAAAAIARGTVSTKLVNTGRYEAADLKQLTVADIKRIAGERGYTITATKKDAIIAEFLEQQDQ